MMMVPPPLFVNLSLEEEEEQSHDIISGSARETADADDVVSEIDPTVNTKVPI